MVCVQAYRDQDSAFIFDNEDEAQIVELFLAELAVGHFVPPPAYFLTPMNIGWAVDILRRAADECKIREIRRPKLYEALDFLEKSVEPAWLVKRYRRELSGDRRNEREKAQLREALRVATRGIQQACVPLLVDKMNDLAVNFREKRTRSIICARNSTLCGEQLDGKPRCALTDQDSFSRLEFWSAGSGNLIFPRGSQSYPAPC